MNQYPQYRSSSIGLVPKVPAHWGENTIKRGFEVTLGKMLQGDRKLDSDLLAPYLRSANVQWGKVDVSDVQEMWFSPDETRQLTLEPGDLVACEGGDAGRAAIWQGEINACYFQNSVNRVRSNGGHSTQFLMYWLSALKAGGFVDIICNKATIAHLTKEKLANLPMVYPPLDEQYSIAAYLETETMRIDDLIDEKRSLLKSLADLRVTRITDILTGTGLEQKKTDSEWLPEIPKGWELKRLKFLGQVRSGVAKGKKYDGQTTVEMPYLRVANVQDGYLKLDEISLIEVSTDEVERYTLQFGDVLMNEGGDYDKLGRGAVWESQIEGCLHQNHVFAVRLDDVDLANWVSAITQTAYAKFYFMNNSKQSTNLASINQGNVKEFPVVLPPPGERLVRQKMLQESLAQIDDLVAHAKREIEVLGEFRSSTITDAVLGRIDVRTAQAH